MTTVEATITNSKVYELKRMGFLPKYFGPTLMLHGEGLVYAWMRKIAPAYNGGHWEFYELSNGGFYMGLDGGTYVVEVDSNGYRGTMSGDAAGIVATSFALSMLVSQLYENIDVDPLLEHLHQLSDFARNHPEAQAIQAALD